MNDHIIIPVTIRYAVWPGGEYTCIRAFAVHGEVGMWLHGPDGAHELLPYRLVSRRRKR